MSKFGPRRAGFLALALAGSLLAIPASAQAPASAPAFSTDANGNKVANSGELGGVKVKAHADGMLVPASGGAQAGTTSSIATSATASSTQNLNLLPLITGRLLDGAGLAASGVQVELFRQVPTDFVDENGKQVPMSIDLESVDTALTDANGFFTGLVGLIDPDANYELRAEIGEELIVYDFAPTANGLVQGILQLLMPAVTVLNAVTGPLTDAVGYLEGLGTLVPQLIRDLIGGLFGDGGNMLAIPPAEFELPDTAPEDPHARIAASPTSFVTNSAAATTQAASYTPRNCPTYAWRLGYKRQPVTRAAWVPHRFTGTALKSIQIVGFKTDKKSKLGVAFDLSGKKYGGGVQYGIETDGSVGIEWTVPNDHFATQYATWEYVRYKEMCRYGGAWAEQRSGVENYKWVATEPAGDSSAPRQFPWGESFSCAKFSNMGAKTTMTSGTTVKFGNSFKVVGITVSAEQTQSTQSYFTIDPDPGQSARYCQSGTTLSTSAQFQELRQ